MGLDIDVLRKALFFASRALSTVVRKRQPDLPYIVHPYRVAMNLIYEGSHNTSLVASAFLHDVLEESNVSHILLYKKFGIEITNLVTQVSDPRELRVNRIKLDSFKVDFIRNYASKDAVLLSLADKLDNTRDLKTELQMGLIQDISRKETYYLGMMEAYKERQHNINNPIFDRLLDKYEAIISELWG